MKEHTLGQLKNDNNKNLNIILKVSYFVYRINMLNLFNHIYINEWLYIYVKMNQYEINCIIFKFIFQIKRLSKSAF